MTGIAARRIDETPVAVVDFETTGLNAGYDRVVEVAVVRVDPGQEPKVVLDTLVNPLRRVSATEIHGITEADVADAPRFADIAGAVVGSLEGCAVAAYNVYFDIRFLNSELVNSGVDHEPPHFCLMYLRPMLGLGPRCKLEDACRANSVEYASCHTAANDAMASGHLLKKYIQTIADRGITTFGELQRLKSYKFCKSWDQRPLPHPSAFKLGPFDRFKSRSGHTKVDPVRDSLRSYWEALKLVLSDLEISDDELNSIVDEQRRLGLEVEQIRSLHARAFANAITQFSDDRRIDDREARKLRKLYVCLDRLGWAPGE